VVRENFTNVPASGMFNAWPLADVFQGVFSSARDLSEPALELPSQRLGQATRRFNPPETGYLAR